MTRWQPDTCTSVACTIDYVTTATSVSAFVPCPVHAAAASTLADCQFKNQVEGEVASRLRGNTTYTITDAATGVVVWRDRAYAWAWNVGRTALVVTITPTLGAGQRNTIQSGCDTLFGVGRVLIQ